MSRTGSVLQGAGRPWEGAAAWSLQETDLFFPAAENGETQAPGTHPQGWGEASGKQANKPAQPPEKHNGEGPHLLTLVLVNTGSHVQPLPLPLCPHSAASEGPAEWRTNQS